MPESEENIINLIIRRFQDEGLPEEFITFYRELFYHRLVFKKSFNISRPLFPPDSIQESISTGIPILVRLNIEPDSSSFGEQFRKILPVLQRVPEISHNLTGVLLKCEETISNPQTFQRWLKECEIPDIPDGIKSETWNLLLDEVFNPVLESYCDVLLPEIDQEKWRRGYCPICGGFPDLAVLDKENGSRWLICRRCNAHWRFQRIECPYCHCTDQKSLSYYTDDSGLYRLYTCDQCKGYLKAVDERVSQGETVIPLERIRTLSLDMQARDLGYRTGNEVTPDRRPYKQAPSTCG